MEKQKKRKSFASIKVEALKTMCEWCASKHDCQFYNKKSQEPCVQYLAVSKAIKM